MKCTSVAPKLQSLRWVGELGACVSTIIKKIMSDILEHFNMFKTMVERYCDRFNKKI